MNRLAKKMRIFADSLRFYGPRRTVLHVLRSLAFDLLRATGRRYATGRVLGHPMLLDLRRGGISRTLYIYGERETDLVLLLTEVLRPGDLVVDVGANIGAYVLLESRLTAPGGRVAALEPDPRNLDLLRRNVAMAGLEGRVEVRQEAVSRASGPMRLGLHAKSNLNTLLDGETPVEHDLAESIPVQAVGLAELLARTGPPALVRMDIEGHETPVLEGLADMLGRTGAPLPRRVALEVHPALYGPGGGRMRSALERLLESAYAVEALTVFMDQGDPLAHLGLAPQATARSEYHVWGIHRNLRPEHALEAICGLGAARHVMLAARETGA
ncbi:MAG: FkbM family methyltransferase [Thermodesulfobacteriota bacterium]